MIREHLAVVTALLVTIGIGVVMSRRNTTSPAPQIPTTGRHLRLVTATRNDAPDGWAPDEGGHSESG